MLLRIVRRSPWIAAGAAGMYFLDPAHGPQRRAELGERARTVFHDIRRSLIDPGPARPDATIVDIELGVEPTGIGEDAWVAASTPQPSAAG